MRNKLWSYMTLHQAMLSMSRQVPYCTSMTIFHIVLLAIRNSALVCRYLDSNLALGYEIFPALPGLISLVAKGIRHVLYERLLDGYSRHESPPQTITHAFVSWPC